ncbi:MAG: AEC family transporter [bacterium]
MDIVDSLKINFLAIGQALVLGLIGFYIIRLGVLGQCCLKTISNLVVDVTLPCFIFTNILTNFHNVSRESLLLFPAACLLVFAVAAGMSFVYTRADRGLGKNREFISIVTFQNSGFLPLIIIGALYPKDQQGKMFLYVFLFLLLYNVVLFTLGETLFSRGARKFPGVKNLLSPAVVATVVSLAMALLNAGRFVPDVVFKPLKMLGETTIPLSMIVIGGIVMVNYAGKTKFPYAFVLKAGALKLLALPVVIFLLMLPFRMSPEARFLIALEAMMPPASILPLIAGKYDGDHNLIGQALFGMTVLSLITVPILLAVMHLAPKTI